ncbi:hypothetical protein [Raoultella ornithinolytica]|uniref:hypothetical protein n=1 Tax=Raoultella ornithinolytica TaxID=54291 RepID=UPI00301CA74D
MPKYTGMTEHAKHRLHQRSSLSVDEISDIMHQNMFINLGSKPGIPKAHLLIYSNKDHAWFVIVKDTINGDIITFLTEEYHTNLFGKIAQKAKDEVYNLTLSNQFNFATKPKRPAININISLGYNDVSGYRKVKKIYSIPYAEMPPTKEFFFNSSEYNNIKKMVFDGVHSGIIGNLLIGKDFHPIFLKVSFSKSDYVIIEI